MTNTEQLKKDFEQHTAHSCEQIKHICSTIGPRGAGSQQELDAQKYMIKELENIADKIETEEFTIHKHAFLGFIPFTVVFLLIGFLFYWKYFPALGLFFTVVAAIPAVLEFGLYYKFTDPLFPSQQSHNTIATLKPSGPIKQRLILTGHSDSMFEWNLVYLFGPYGMRLTIIPAAVNIILTLIGSFADTILVHLLHIDIEEGIFPPAHNVAIFIITCTIPSVLAMLFFWNPFKCVPGATDNLTGCYTSISIMKQLGQSGIKLKNTELVVLLTGSEEAGIRGAKAYVYRHQRELKETPTLCIAVDSIRDIDEMALFTRDLNGIVKLDEQSANLINKAASNSCQITLPLKPMPFGATDAVAFAQVGIKTVALCAMELTPPRWYHTRLDTPENMIPSAIEKCMEVCYHAALLFDEVGFEGSANRNE